MLYRDALSVLSPSRANIPQYGPRARLARGYYYMALSHKDWELPNSQI